MRALLLTAPSELHVIDDAPTPTPGADEVVVRVHACGICGSDLHGWDGSSGRRRPPLIMGHEAAGEIAELGAQVTGWTKGERVAMDSTLFCGECDDCRAGRVNLCECRRVLGVAPAEYRQDGAFAEYVAVPTRALHRIPAGLPWEHAAMVEPVSIAVHAVGRVALGDSSSAVVVGAGMIGLLVIQALRWKGVRQIIAVDLEPERLELARRLGATDVVNSSDGAGAASVVQLTNGRGADVAFEVVGYAPTLRLALESVRRGGGVVLVGNLAPKVEFPLQYVVTRELTLYASCAAAGEYPVCIDLIARRVIDVAPLIAATVPLAEGPEWFRRLSAPGGGRTMKVILRP